MEEVCSIRLMKFPPGKSTYGLFTTGSAPAPSAPNAIINAPMVPIRRSHANRRIFSGSSPEASVSRSLMELAPVATSKALPLKGSARLPRGGSLIWNQRCRCAAKCREIGVGDEVPEETIFCFQGRSNWVESARPSSLHHSTQGSGEHLPRIRVWW